MAACVLHNLIITRNKLERADADHEDPVSGEVIEGAWRSEGELNSLTSRQQYTASQLGKNVRNHLRAYVNSPADSVSWQESMI